MMQWTGAVLTLRVQGTLEVLSDIAQELNISVVKIAAMQPPQVIFEVRISHFTPPRLHAGSPLDRGC